MNTPTTILVAGAGGHAGQYIVPMLLQQGYSVRILTRNRTKLVAQYSRASYPNVEIIEADITKPSSLQGVFHGVDTVISTVGASLDMFNFSDRRSFHEVDFLGNSNLLKEAVAANVRKFVYVSAFNAETTNTAYTNEHEAFVKLLRQSGLEYTIVRPTGFFYINAEFVKMAQQGRGMLVGDGSARTNPIHEEDVAKACVQALSSTEQTMNIGGAETFTRKEIVELAFRTVGKKPSISRIPFGIMNLGSKIARVFNRRIGEMVEFGAVVATQDCVAPAVQTSHRLEAYFRELTETSAQKPEKTVQ